MKTGAARNVLVAVAWPYVNGDIHIGHLAGYLLPADVYARFHRFAGNRVLMVSGSDCYGTPITVEADARGITPLALVEEYHPKTVALFRDLGLSYDLYTRTTTDNHAKVTQDIFMRFLEKGLLFRDMTKQYYSPAETRFLPDRYVEGTCPRCGTKDARSDQCDACGAPLAEGELVDPVSRTSRLPVELRPTEHYFLDWGKLQPFLERFVDERAGAWRDWVRAETKKWLREGLKPRAITRDLDWGVEIPVDRIPLDDRIEGSSSKRIYVWFEAVIGYLSASMEWAGLEAGRRWEDFWYDEHAVHAYFMGKDNLVFHTLFWPGELHVFDERLHLPDIPAINQYLTFGGQKFSKSRGVTVDTRAAIERYGLDVVRFYTLSITPESADASFTWEDFVQKTNSVLIGNIGNLVNRSLKLVETSGAQLGSELDPAVAAEIDAHLARGYELYSQCRFRESVDNIISLSAFGNRYVTAAAPWAVKEKQSAAFTGPMSNVAALILALAALLKPVIPGTVESLARMMGTGADSWPHGGAAELAKLVPRVQPRNVTALFTKLELPPPAA